MIETLIFDFDGLLLDTETVAYQSWKEIYQEHNCMLPLEKWILRVGGSIASFDAHCYLEIWLSTCDASLKSILLLVFVHVKRILGESRMNCWLATVNENGYLQKSIKSTGEPRLWYFHFFI